MIDIFKWECTINGICLGHLLWKYCILLKKHKIASPEKSTSSYEKEWNFLGFYTRIKTKAVLESIKDFLQNV